MEIEQVQHTSMRTLILSENELKTAAPVALLTELEAQIEALTLAKATKSASPTERRATMEGIIGEHKLTSKAVKDELLRRVEAKDQEIAALQNQLLDQERVARCTRRIVSEMSGEFPS